MVCLICLRKTTVKQYKNPALNTVGFLYNYIIMPYKKRTQLSPGNILEQNISLSLHDIGYIVIPYKNRTQLDPKNVIYSQVTRDDLPRVRLDFALINARIAIEVQGDYWHAINEYRLNTSQLQAVTRDKYKRKLLSRKHWKLIHIHEKHLINVTVEEYLQKSIWRMLEI